jgi:hypothetical protein
MMRRSKLGLKLRGSIGVPCRGVKTRPVSIRALPARSALESSARQGPLPHDEVSQSEGTSRKGRCPRGHSFLATSGPVMRLRSGNVEAMIASEAASPPMTVAQYAIPGMLNAMPTREWR